MSIRKRPAVILVICCFTFLAWEALQLGYDVQAGVAIGALAVLAPKLIDSEEKDKDAKDSNP